MVRRCQGRSGLTALHSASLRVVAVVVTHVTVGALVQDVNAAASLARWTSAQSEDSPQLVVG